MQAFFSFHNVVHKKGMGPKEKIKLPFKGFLIILFQSNLFSKQFLACISCLGLFTKIEKRSGMNFWSIFSSYFFYKNVPCIIIEY